MNHARPAGIRLAFHNLMKLYIGTSGFSYKQWKGPFYPESLPDNLMLHFYGEHYPTVEINNTFYRMPKLDLLKSWARQVPDDFRFVFKTCKDCKTWKSPWKGRGTAPGPLLLSPFGPLSDP